MLSTIERLKQILELRPRDLVIVVGAGVSLDALQGSSFARVASWQGLLHAGLDAVARGRGPGSQDVGRVRGLLDSEDAALWIEAAEWLTRMLGGPKGGAFRAWLRETAGAFAGAFANVRREPAVLAALAAMEELGALLVTTNYDGLLEAVTGAPPVTWREPAMVERVIRGDDRGILHLHGYWKDPESVVLGRGSYDEVVRDAHARAMLLALRMLRTFVYVGHGAGLSDPNMGSFLRWTEQVFEGSEYEHYRLVREDEHETTQAAHAQAQRILALPYGRAHADLAPFLMSLLPASRVLREPAAEAAGGSATPPSGGAAITTTIILLLNIGDKDHHWLTTDHARAQVEDPAAVVLEVKAIISRKAITPRDWGELARQLDDLVEAADRVTTGRARYVVMGQAPLPVFVYLGRRMSRLGPITVINRRGAEWDRIGPIEALPAGGREDFESVAPSLGRERKGKVVLSIQCSGAYSYNEAMVVPMIEASGDRLLASYRIHNEKNYHRDVPMTGAELRVLLRHVAEAIKMLGEQCRESDGLVLCLGGPSWVGFWVGYCLSQNAYGGRIDVPNFIPGEGYRRALASPMHWAPRLAGAAKLLIVASEPDDQGRTRASKGADTIVRGLERELGEDGPHKIKVHGAAEFGEIIRTIEIFEPDILHLHLHGSPAGLLAFEDARGETQRIPGEAFVEMLRATGVRPTLIVLSACHSAVLAPALGELVDCVVSMADTVAYATAIAFAGHFYGSLARGNSVAKAFALGKVGAGHDGILLTTAPGVVADEIVLYRPPDHRRK